MIKLKRSLILTGISLLLIGVAAPVLVVRAQEETEQTEPPKKEKRRAKKGAKWGAAGGAITGLALGALTGDAKLAAAGAVAGGVVGAGAGAKYEYDQGKQDDRTQMMAEAIAAQGGTTVVVEAPKGATVGEVGKQHMADFLGDWKVDVWVLGPEGKRVSAKGTAKGIAAGENATRILYRDIKAEGYDLVVSGYLLMSYDPGQGFFLENSFSTSDEVVRMVGEYQVDKNAYNYYLLGDEGGEMVQGEIVRSALRVEVRVASPSIFVAESYVLLDGEEVQVQNYRFTKS